MRMNLLAKGSEIKVGQKVYCGLYGGKYGMVLAIHGKQDAGSIQHLAGISAGGRADFDIVFPNHISRGLPECILWGVQWKVFDEIGTPEEIAALVAESEASVTKAKADAEAASKRRAEERIRHAAENPHLTKMSDKPKLSCGRVAAMNMRVELKKAFPRVKFSVKSDHNSVTVEWTDGPTKGEIDAIIGKYKGSVSSHCGDYMENDPDATFADVFGDPTYVFPSRIATREGVAWAWSHAKDMPNLPGGCSWGKAEDVTEEWHNHPESEWMRRTWAVTSLPLDLPVAATV